MDDPKRELKSFASKIEGQLKGNYFIKAIDEMYNYAISGGKRLRPSVLLASCGAVGGDLDSAIPAAAAIELLHKFTLVHDDIIDKDDLRRGKPTFYVKYGLGKGIFLGDLISSEAFDNLKSLKYDDKTILKCYTILSDTYYKLCIGEFLDITLPSKKIITEKEYLNLLYLKAGCLLEASAKIGAILGGGTEEEINSLAEYAKNFALAMQMLNDIKDNLSRESRKLKLKSSDIQENKWSIPLIYTLNHLPQSERTNLQSILRKETKSNEEIDMIINYFKKTGSLEYANKLIKQYFDIARSSLKNIKDSKYKQFLISLSNAATDKWYWEKNE